MMNSGACRYRLLARAAQFLALCAALSLQAETIEYVLAPSSGGRFELTVEKTGLMKGRKHLFVFERYDGQMVFDREQPENSRVRFRLESKSIFCRDTWVSDKDRGKILDTALNEMLAAERYRYVSFESDAAQATGPNRYEVRGRLRIRDIEKPATVLVTVTAGEDGRLVLDGSSVVKMTDYGLKPPSAALGLIGTREEMTVRFSLRTAPRGTSQPTFPF